VRARGRDTRVSETRAMWPHQSNGSHASAGHGQSKQSKFHGAGEIHLVPDEKQGLVGNKQRVKEVDLKFYERKDPCAESDFFHFQTLPICWHGAWAPKVRRFNCSLGWLAQGHWK
jgi:hypothetical protein